MKRYLVFAVIFFALGVFVANWCDRIALGWVFCCLILLPYLSCISIVVGIFFGKKMHKYQILTVFLPVVAMLGCCHFINFEFYRQRELRNFQGKTVRLYGRICAIPVLSKNTGITHYTLDVIKIEHLNQVNSLNGKCLISSSESGLNYDDHVNCIITLSAPKEAAFAGGFDYAKSLRERDIFLVGHTQFFKIESLKVRPKYIDKIGTYLHQNIALTIDKLLTPDYSIVLKALMLGEKNEFPSKMKDDFIKSGMVPLITISGMHVSLIFAGLERFLKKLQLSKLIICLTIIPILIIFVVISGYTISVKRSVFMLIIYLFSIILKQESDALTTLFACGGILLFSNPYSLFSPSFLMSFGAVLGMEIFTAPINSLHVNKNIALSIAATIGTSFFTACFFNVIGISSLLSNAVSAWLASLLFMSGYILWIINPISANFTGLIANILKLPLSLFVKLSEYISIMPLNFSVSSPKVPGFCVYICVCVIFYYLLTSKEVKTDEE